MFMFYFGFVQKIRIQKGWMKNDTECHKGKSLSKGVLMFNKCQLFITKYFFVLDQKTQQFGKKFGKEQWFFFKKT